METNQPDIVMYYNIVICFNFSLKSPIHALDQDCMADDHDILKNSHIVYLLYELQCVWM